uniref:IncF plasmid conjugative transfer regulator TraJ n=1 Tax=Escherichia coli TaxID=562 RepID=A0A890DHV5_ECOLX|nr:IncF plasmid conjugative transfer regulator TraJ [Escherichia coli]
MYQIFSITPPAVYLLVTTYVCRIIRRMSDDSSVSSYVNDVFYLYSTGISHHAIAL